MCGRALLRPARPHISDASHGVNLGGRPRGLELPSQVMHMDRDGVGFALVIQAVESFLEHGLRHEAAQPPHQMFQDCALPACKVTPSAPPGRRSKALMRATTSAVAKGFTR